MSVSFVMLSCIRVYYNLSAYYISNGVKVTSLRQVSIAIFVMIFSISSPKFDVIFFLSCFEFGPLTLGKFLICFTWHRLHGNLGILWIGSEIQSLTFWKRGQIYFFICLFVCLLLLLLLLFYSFRVFRISVSWLSFTGVWVTASLLKSPGLVSGFWPFVAVLSFW